MLKFNQIPTTVRFGSILLLSNLLTLFIFQVSPEAEVIERPRFVQVRIQGTLKTPFVKQKKITLTNASRTQIIDEAYLINEIILENDFAEEALPQFVVEIPEQKLPLVSQNTPFHIYPYSPTLKQKGDGHDLSF